MRFRRINEQARREAQQKIELKLKDFSHLEEQELFETLDASKRGLSEEVALERLEENGKNLITTSRKNTVLKRLFEALVNPFNIVFFCIACVL